MIKTNNQLNSFQDLIDRLQKGFILAQDISVTVDILLHVKSLQEAAVSATNKEKVEIANDLLALEVLVNDLSEHYEKPDNKIPLRIEAEVDKILFTKGSSPNQKMAPPTNRASAANFHEAGQAGPISPKAPIWF